MTICGCRCRGCIDHERRTGFDGDAGEPGCRRILDSCGADCRQINPTILLRLDAFHQHATTRRRFIRHTMQQGVGARIILETDNPALRSYRALPTIFGAQLTRRTQCHGDIGRLLNGRQTVTIGLLAHQQ